MQAVTTPTLLAVFSLVTLFSHRRMMQRTEAFRQAGWYRGLHLTFSDAPALVRKELCAAGPRRVFAERLSETVCYAA